VKQFTDYDSYVRAEWQLFDASPERQSAAREAVAGLEITRVLDLGCGAGQELRPFVCDPRSMGVGIDLSPEVGIAGRKLFALEQPGSHVVFVRAAAECLPLTSSSVDLVICRLV
jgi:ubiquinone/menaquinone biosynthesis C-methylase UbiE